MDGENHQFIDILIENEQKMVISEYVVQVELSNICLELLTIFVCVSGLPAADLGGSDELANMEDGRSIFHLRAHSSGGYFCFHNYDLS